MSKGLNIFSGVMCTTSSVLFGTTAVALGAETVNSWKELDQNHKIAGAVATAAFAMSSLFLYREATKSFERAFVRPIKKEIRLLEIELEGFDRVLKNSNSKTKKNLEKSVAGNQESSELLDKIKEYTKGQEEIMKQQQEIRECAEQNNPDPEAHKETEEPNHHVIRPPKKRGFFGFKK